MVKENDDIESKTIYFEGLGDFTQNTCCNESDSKNEINLDEMILYDMVLLGNDKLVAQGKDAERTHNTLIQLYHIKGISIKEADTVCYESDISEENVNQHEAFLGSEHFDNHVPPVDVNFIIPYGTETQTLKDDCSGKLLW